MEGTSYYMEGEERFGTFSSRIYSSFSGMHYWMYHRAVVREVLKLSPQSVLDVGCGPGDVLAHLAVEHHYRLKAEALWKRATLLHSYDVPYNFHNTLCITALPYMFHYEFCH